jgi:hypothetical protein
MTRKFLFATAMIAMGTLAGCSRAGNPLAPAADARVHASQSAKSGTTTTTTTSAAGTGDEAPSDSLPGNSNGVVFTQGGN